MTQQKIILNILSDKDWHCTNEFYASYIADPRTRIVELKKKGYILIWQWCKTHSHKKSKEWRLVELPNHASEAPTSEKMALSSDLQSKDEESYVQAPLLNFYSYNYRH